MRCLTLCRPRYYHHHIFLTTNRGGNGSGSNDPTEGVTQEAPKQGSGIIVNPTSSGDLSGVIVVIGCMVELYIKR